MDRMGCTPDLESSDRVLDAFVVWCCMSGRVKKTERECVIDRMMGSVVLLLWMAG
jgi:hypothetical protein